MRRAGCPREAGPLHRIRIHLAITVAQSGIREQSRRRPLDRERHVVARSPRCLGPVEMRRGIEIAGQKDRRAVDSEPAQCRQRLGFHGARALFNGEHVGERAAVPCGAEPGRTVREVYVRDRDDLARPHHDPRVHGIAVECGDRVRRRPLLRAFTAARVEDRPAREQPSTRVDVRHAGSFGNSLEVAVGFLQADDIGIRGAYGLADLGEADLLAAVPDVEGHHPQRHRRGRGRVVGARIDRNGCRQ